MNRIQWDNPVPDLGEIIWHWDGDTPPPPDSDKTKSGGVWKSSPVEAVVQAWYKLILEEVSCGLEDDGHYKTKLRKLFKTCDRDEAHVVAVSDLNNKGKVKKDPDPHGLKQFRLNKVERSGRTLENYASHQWYDHYCPDDLFEKHYPGLSISEPCWLHILTDKSNQIETEDEALHWFVSSKNTIPVVAYCCGWRQEVDSLESAKNFFSAAQNRRSAKSAIVVKDVWLEYLAGKEK